MSTTDYANPERIFQRNRATAASPSSVNTASGGYLDVSLPCLDDIKIEDIAEGLARQCRFGGQLPHDRFYSVAQHCVHVCRSLREEGRAWVTQLQGLLHDAAEAYVGDMQAPLKRLCPQYRSIEKGLQIAVYQKFGLPLDDTSAVKFMDQRVFLAEKEIVLGNFDLWPGAPGITKASIDFTCWPWKAARAAFLHEFNYICLEMK